MHSSPQRPRIRWIDRAGLFAAVGCGLHCAALGLVLLLYPTLWLHRGLRESGLWTVLWWTEYSLLAVAWILATAAVARVRCRWRAPAALVVVGLALLTVAIATPLHGTSPRVSLMALTGGLLVGTAHWLNLRRLRAP